MGKSVDTNLALIESADAVLTADRLSDGGLLAKMDRFISALNHRMASAGVLLMLVVAVFTTIDVVVMRFLFNSPIAGSNEFFGTLFAVGLSGVLASGISSRATLDIDVLAGILGDRWVGRLRALGAAVYLLVLTILFVALIEQALHAYQRGMITTIQQWKLWPWYVGICALFFLCVPAQAITSLRLATNLPGSAARNFAVVFLLAFGLVIGGMYAMEYSQSYFADHSVLVTLALFAALWVLILIFIPLAGALVVCSVLGIAGLFGMNAALNISGSETIALLTSADLAIIPFFLMMGGFAVAGGMSIDIYRLAHAIFSPFRGGLAMATIGGCAGFGALTGSSAATVATIGAVSYPEMKRRGYASTLSTGCVAAGGTLGQLIPPSTILVVYALLVEQSIGTLYIAVLVPAFLTILFYMATIAILVLRRPEIAPAGTPWDRNELISAALDCIPVFVLFLLVFGGIFFGVFTATEAAAVGAILSFAVAVYRGKLSSGRFWKVAAETTRSTSMIYFLIIGGLIFTFFMASGGVPVYLTELLLKLHLPGWASILILTAILVVLGTAMDSMTILMVTASLFAGVVQGLGYDPIWWGIIMIMVVEIGVVSPPFGINLFMMKGVAPDVSLGTVFRGVMPFVYADAIKILVLLAFPILTLWLPGLL